VQVVVVPGPAEPPEQSPVVQALPSLQALELFVWMHPVPEEQESLVHGLLSSQFDGVPATHVPPLHESPEVHESPSLQAAPFDSLLATQLPEPLQVSGLSQAVSIDLQAFRSSGCRSQCPLAGIADGAGVVVATGRPVGKRRANRTVPAGRVTPVVVREGAVDGPDAIDCRCTCSSVEGPAMDEPCPDELAVHVGGDLRLRARHAPDAQLVDPADEREFNVVPSVARDAEHGGVRGSDRGARPTDVDAVAGAPPFRCTRIWLAAVDDDRDVSPLP
jgi:hypothetical protein